MKKTALVLTALVLTAGVAAPSMAEATESSSEIKTNIQYLKSLFMPTTAPKAIPRPRKTKF